MKQFCSSDDDSISRSSVLVSLPAVSPDSDTKSACDAKFAFDAVNVADDDMLLLSPVTELTQFSKYYNGVFMSSSMHGSYRMLEPVQ